MSMSYPTIASSQDRPLVCVTPRYELDQKGLCASESVGELFLEALFDAGALPVMMPLTCDPEIMARYIEICDGFALPGGKGPEPRLWGEEPTRFSQNSAERDALEVPLLQMLAQTNKPVLAICRGMQLMNIVFGGNLCQDINEMPLPEGKVHWNHHANIKRVAHSVELEKGSLIHRICGRDEIQVNSSHRFCVRDVAPQLTVSAAATDGIVEALELSEKPFFLGVQWHPEYTWRFLETDRALWHAFVRACSDERKK